MAKYRPNVPILTLVVPQLKSKGLAWELEGRSLARQFLIMRGMYTPPPVLTQQGCHWLCRRCLAMTH